MVSRSAAESTGGSVMKPKMNKKLTLSRETVRELTDSQLDLAAGQSGGDSVEACCLTNRICSQDCATNHCSQFTYICNTAQPCYPPCH
jgi:hypothetical protein